MIKTSELEEYLEEYIEEKKEKNNLTDATIKKSTLNIQAFLDWLNKQEIEELDEYNIKRCLRRYRSYCLNERNNKRSTVKTYLINVIGFLNYDEIQIQTKHKKIVIKDIIEVRTENPETARKRIEKISLTRKQTDFFLETIKYNGDVRDYAICKTFFDSGMRLGELVQLNKTDIKAPINKQGFYVLPDNPSTVIDVHLRAATTKGQYKDRTTFITYDTLLAINKMIMKRMTTFIKKKHQRDIIKVRPDRMKDEKNREELFTTVMGTRFSKRGIQDIIKKYALLCDKRIEQENIKCPINYCKNVSVHILRHTSLSRYAEILTVAEVQTIAGHANSVTTDRYIHVDHSKIKEKISAGLEA